MSSRNLIVRDRKADPHSAVPDSPQTIVDDATLAFTLGETDAALAQLEALLGHEPTFLPAWHALAEICFEQRDLKRAQDAGLRALELAPDDVHIHTTLSRIFMEQGDKAQAEHHGARARVLGWKSVLADEDAPG